MLVGDKSRKIGDLCLVEVKPLQRRTLGQTLVQLVKRRFSASSLGP
jgi:hypothetical protein